MDSRASECRCYPWVVRCAHLENRVVILVDNSLPTPEALQGCHGGPSFNDFNVGSGEWKPCGEGCGMGGTTIFNPTFPDLPAAEAEFHRREEELILSSAPAAAQRIAHSVRSPRAAAESALERRRE